MSYNETVSVNASPRYSRDDRFDPVIATCGYCGAAVTFTPSQWHHGDTVDCPQCGIGDSSTWHRSHFGDDLWCRICGDEHPFDEECPQDVGPMLPYRKPMWVWGERYWSRPSLTRDVAAVIAAINQHGPSDDRVARLTALREALAAFPKDTNHD